MKLFYLTIILCLPSIAFGYSVAYDFNEDSKGSVMLSIPNSELKSIAEKASRELKKEEPKKEKSKLGIPEINPEFLTSFSSYLKAKTSGISNKNLKKQLKLLRIGLSKLSKNKKLLNSVRNKIRQKFSEKAKIKEMMTGRKLGLKVLMSDLTAGMASGILGGVISSLEPSNVKRGITQLNFNLKLMKKMIGPEKKKLNDLTDIKNDMLLGVKKVGFLLDRVDFETKNALSRINDAV